MKSIPLPVSTFIAHTSAGIGPLFPCRQLFQGEKDFDFDDTVIASTPLKEVDWSQLFAYMYRRFGPPHVGGDDYKDLAAGWMITTPDPALCLIVSPSLSGADFSLRPYFTPGDAKADPRVVDTLPASRAAELKAAYSATLVDLLRPVCVRDQWINAMGEVDDDSPLLAYDDEEDAHLYTVERHGSSGNGIPLGLLGGKDWNALVGMLLTLGSGDMESGKRAALALLRKEVFGEAQRASAAVKLLMVLAARVEHDLLIKGLGLGGDELQAFEMDLKRLKDPASSKGDLVRQMDALSVKTAADFMKRLGMDAWHLKDTVKSLHLSNSVAEAFEDLRKVSENQFPDIDFPEDVWIPEADLAAQLKDAFAKKVAPKFSEWVDQTLARPEGVSALREIVCHLRHEREREVQSQEDAMAMKQSASPS